MSRRSHSSAVITLLLSVIVWVPTTHVMGQQPTAQDCLGAIPVCAQVYTEGTSPSGFGAYANEVNPSISCLFDDNNAIWYTFTVNASGNFGFILTPNDPRDDYDWALFNLTNASCEQIKELPDLLVSCNAAGGFDCHGPTGASGATPYTIQGGGCNAQSPSLAVGNSPFNDFVQVIEGNTYVLMVSNWTGSTNGYQINFGVSDDIGIRDDIPPEIGEILLNAENGCAPSEITLLFTEAILCESISKDNVGLIDAEGSSYDIDLFSTICERGGTHSREYVVKILSPLKTTSERYTLSVAPLMESPVKDLCGNTAIAYNASFEVTIPPLPEINLPADTLVCDQSSITLDLSHPDIQNYRWQDGSSLPTLVITASGNYSVTIANQCDSTTYFIEVNLINDEDIDLDLGRDTSVCEGSTFRIDVGLGTQYTYRWDDGIGDQAKLITQTGTYRLQISNQCGVLGSDEISINFVDRRINLDLGERDIVCRNDILILDATDPNALSYLWEDGSINPTREIRSGGQYAVTLSNECGAIEDAIDIFESNCTECHLYMPNCIAPEGQNDNARWIVTSNCKMDTYELRIYDRWGTQLFETDDPMIPWMGLDSDNKPVSNGVYVYHLRLSYFEFAEFKEELLIGDISVIR